MASQTDARVDLSDPIDIRSKLPGIRALYEAKRQSLSSLEQEVEYWRQMIRYLSAVAGEPVDVGDAPPTASGRAPSQDAAVAALASYGQPAGPATLYRYMLSQGLPVKNANQVGANLWAAHKAGRIGKTSDGLYAPPGWTADKLASSNGSTGESFSEATSSGPVGMGGNAPLTLTDGSG